MKSPRRNHGLQAVEVEGLDAERQLWYSRCADHAITHRHLQDSSFKSGTPVAGVCDGSAVMLTARVRRVRAHFSALRVGHDSPDPGIHVLQGGGGCQEILNQRLSQFVGVTETTPKNFQTWPAGIALLPETEPTPLLTFIPLHTK